jgi:hypothetical protein
MDDAGDFVVVWQSQGQDGAAFDYGIFASRFNSAGVAQATEFQVNSFTPLDQYQHAVASDADGDFVVAWTSEDQDGSELGVFAQRFSSAGVRQGGEFQANLYSNSDQFTPAVARDADGDFVIAWREASRDGGGTSVFAQRFNSSGARLGGEFQVNSYTSSNQDEPAVAMDDDGDFVIAWNSFGQDGNLRGIFARRFNAAGVAQASEFRVNSYTSGDQLYPSVAIDGNGDFVVTWQSNGQDGGFEGVFARRFNAAGTAQGVELQASVYTVSNQSDPVAAMDGDGDFVLAWHSNEQDGSSTGVFGRSWSSSGVPQAEFQVNTFTPIGQQYATAAMDADGDFVVAWHGNGQDGGLNGIFAQRFGTSAVLDIDGNGTVAPLTDGLLVLRFLFGFTGAPLVNGAVALDCNRCGASAIGAYLAGLTVLDVDGNGGQPAPLTDGLLVLRFLFGFTGATLVNGATGQGCTRCDGPSVAAYLQPLV